MTWRGTVWACLGSTHELIILGAIATHRPLTRLVVVAEASVAVIHFPAGSTAVEEVGSTVVEEAGSTVVAQEDDSVVALEASAVALEGSVAAAPEVLTGARVDLIDGLEVTRSVQETVDLAAASIEARAASIGPRLSEGWRGSRRDECAGDVATSAVHLHGLG